MAWLSVCRSAAARRMPPSPRLRALAGRDTPDPEHDDPDVLDRVQRQQPLEVVRKSA